MPTDFSQLRKNYQSGVGRKIPTTPSNYNVDLSKNTRLIDLDDNYVYGGVDEGYLPIYPEFRPGAPESYYGDRQSSGEVWGNAWKRFWNEMTSQYYGATVESRKELYKDIANLSGFSDDYYAERLAKESFATRYKYPIYRTSEEIKYDASKPASFGKSFGRMIPFYGANPGRAWARTLADAGFTVGIGLSVATDILGEMATKSAIGAGAGASVTLPAGGVGAAPGFFGGLGVGLVTGIGKGIRTIANAHKIFKAARTADNVVDLTKQLGKVGQKIKNLNTIKNYGKAGLNAIKGYRLAAFESSFEAGMYKHDFYLDQAKKFKEEQGYVTQEDLEAIDEAGNNLADSVFTGNAVILSLSNMLMLSTVFGRSVLPVGMPNKLAKFNPFSRAIVNRGGKAMMMKDVTRQALNNKLGKKLGSFIMGTQKVGSFIASNSIREGLEEVGQGIVGKAAMNYYDLFDNEYGKSSREFYRALGDAQSEVFDTGQAWDEFVAGGIMGLGMSGARATIGPMFGMQTKSQRDEASRKMLKDLNQGIEDYAKAYLNGPTFTNFNQQLKSKTNLDVAESEADVKRVKDIRAEARAELFRKMHEYGFQEEYLDALMDVAEGQETTMPGFSEEFFQGKSREELKSDLNSEFQKYSKIRSNYDAFLQKSLGRNASKQDVAAARLGAHILASNEYQLKDVEARVKNIRSDLSRIVTENSKTAKDASAATRVEAILETLLDPMSIQSLLASEKSALEAMEELAKDTNLSENDKKIRQAEIADQKRYVETLEAIESKMFDKDGNLLDYSSDRLASASMGILNAIMDFAPAASQQEFAGFLLDYLKLNSDASYLALGVRLMMEAKPADILSTVKKEIEIANKKKELADKKRNVNKAGIDPNVATSESITEEQFKAEVEKQRELKESATDINNVLETLASLRPMEGSTMYLLEERDENGNRKKGTLVEAQNEILNRMLGEEATQKYGDLFRKRANGIIQERTGSKEDINKVKEEINEKQKEIDDLEREKKVEEIIGSTEEKTEENLNNKIEELDKRAEAKKEQAKKTEDKQLKLDLQEEAKELEEKKEVLEDYKKAMTGEEAETEEAEETTPVEEDTSLTEKEKKQVNEGEITPETEEKVSKTQKKGKPLNEEEKKVKEESNKKHKKQHANTLPQSEQQLRRNAKNERNPQSGSNSKSTMGMNKGPAVAKLYYGNLNLDRLKQSSTNRVRALIEEIEAQLDRVPFAVMKISMNDNVITEGVVDLTAENQAGIVERVKNGEMVVVRDEKGALHVIQRGTDVELTIALRENYRLNRNPDQTLTKGNFIFGELILSTFEEETLDETDSQGRNVPMLKLQELTEGDVLELFIPANDRNQRLLADLSTGVITQEEYNDNVVVLIQSGGVTVGVLQGGLGNAKGNQNAKSIRTQITDSGLLGTFDGEVGVQVGTVKVSGKQIRRRYLPAKLETSENSKEGQTARQRALEEIAHIDGGQTIESFERSLKGGTMQLLLGQVDEMTGETSLINPKTGKIFSPFDVNLPAVAAGAVYVSVLDEQGITTTSQAFKKAAPLSAGQRFQGQTQAAQPTFTVEGFNEFNIKRDLNTILHPGGNFTLSMRASVEASSYKPTGVSQSTVSKEKMTEAEGNVKNGKIEVETKDGLVENLSDVSLDEKNDIISGTTSMGDVVSLKASDLKNTTLNTSPDLSSDIRKIEEQNKKCK